MPQRAGRPLKVGLVLQTSIDSDGRIPPWNEIRAFAQHAEAVGFDSLWLPDHLSIDLGYLLGSSDKTRVGMWECWSILSSLASVTSRVELGPLVACTSFRNPALLAKMADTVDEISGGRLILGLGGGWNEPEYDAFGYPFDHRVSRFEEALQIIHALLRKGSVDFRGQYYEARNCELLPRGPRPGGPPILIGAREPRMCRLTAQYADYGNTMFIHQPESIAAARLSMDEACAKADRDPATLQRTAFMLIDQPGAYEGRLADQVRQFRSGRGASVTGTAEELAELFWAFAREGISHVQLWPEPGGMGAIDTLAPVLELLDRG